MSNSSRSAAAAAAAAPAEVKESLHGNHKTIIEGTVDSCLEGISALNSADQANTAFNALFDSTIDISIFQRIDLYESIQKIRQIIAHPSPQNRIQTPWLLPSRLACYKIQEADFTKLIDVEKSTRAKVVFKNGKEVTGVLAALDEREEVRQVDAVRLYDPQKKLFEGYEPAGLLGLTTHDDATHYATKEATINYIRTLVDRARLDYRVCCEILDSGSGAVIHLIYNKVITREDVREQYVDRCQRNVDLARKDFESVDRLYMRNTRIFDEKIIQMQDLLKFYNKKGGSPKSKEIEKMLDDVRGLSHSYNVHKLLQEKVIEPKYIFTIFNEQMCDIKKSEQYFSNLLSVYNLKEVQEFIRAGRLQPSDIVHIEKLLRTQKDILVVLGLYCAHAKKILLVEYAFKEYIENSIVKFLIQAGVINSHNAVKRYIHYFINNERGNDQNKALFLKEISELLLLFCLPDAQGLIKENRLKPNDIFEIYMAQEEDNYNRAQAEIAALKRLSQSRVNALRNMIFQPLREEKEEKEGKESDLPSVKRPLGEYEHKLLKQEDLHITEAHLRSWEPPENGSSVFGKEHYEAMIHLVKKRHIRPGEAILMLHRADAAKALRLIQNFPASIKDGSWELVEDGSATASRAVVPVNVELSQESKYVIAEVARLIGHKVFPCENMQECLSLLTEYPHFSIIIFFLKTFEMLTPKNIDVLRQDILSTCFLFGAAVGSKLLDKKMNIQGAKINFENSFFQCQHVCKLLKALGIMSLQNFQLFNELSFTRYVVFHKFLLVLADRKSKYLSEDLALFIKHEEYFENICVISSILKNLDILTRENCALLFRNAQHTRGFLKRLEESKKNGSLTAGSAQQFFNDLVQEYASRPLVLDSEWVALACRQLSDLGIVATDEQRQYITQHAQYAQSLYRGLCTLEDLRNDLTREITIQDCVNVLIRHPREAHDIALIIDKFIEYKIFNKENCRRLFEQYVEYAAFFRVTFEFEAGNVPDFAKLCRELPIPRTSPEECKPQEQAVAQLPIREMFAQQPVLAKQADIQYQEASPDIMVKFLIQVGVINSTDTVKTVKDAVELIMLFSLRDTQELIKENRLEPSDVAKIYFKHETDKYTNAQADTSALRVLSQSKLNVLRGVLAQPDRAQVPSGVSSRIVPQVDFLISRSILPGTNAPEYINFLIECERNGHDVDVVAGMISLLKVHNILTSENFVLLRKNIQHVQQWRMKYVNLPAEELLSLASSDGSSEKKAQRYFESALQECQAVSAVLEELGINTLQNKSLLNQKPLGRCAIFVRMLKWLMEKSVLTRDNAKEYFSLLIKNSEHIEDISLMLITLKNLDSLTSSNRDVLFGHGSCADLIFGEFLRAGFLEALKSTISEAWFADTVRQLQQRAVVKSYRPNEVLLALEKITTVTLAQSQHIIQYAQYAKQLYVGVIVLAGMKQNFSNADMKELYNILIAYPREATAIVCLIAFFIKARIFNTKNRSRFEKHAEHATAFMAVLNIERFTEGNAQAYFDAVCQRFESPLYSAPAEESKDQAQTAAKPSGAGIFAPQSRALQSLKDAGLPLTREDERFYIDGFNAHPQEAIDIAKVICMLHGVHLLTPARRDFCFQHAQHAKAVFDTVNPIILRRDLEGDPLRILVDRLMQTYAVLPAPAVVSAGVEMEVLRRDLPRSIQMGGASVQAAAQPSGAGIFSQQRQQQELDQRWLFGFFRQQRCWSDRNAQRIVQHCGENPLYWSNLRTAFEDLNTARIIAEENIQLYFDNLTAHPSEAKDIAKAICMLHRVDFLSTARRDFLFQYPQCAKGFFDACNPIIGHRNHLEDRHEVMIDAYIQRFQRDHREAAARPAPRA